MPRRLRELVVRDEDGFEDGLAINSTISVAMATITGAENRQMAHRTARRTTGEPSDTFCTTRVLILSLILAGCSALLSGCGTLMTYYIHITSPDPATFKVQRDPQASSSPLPRISIGKLLDVRSDPMVLGKILGGYGIPIGKIQLDEGMVISERLKRDVEEILRATGYEVVSPGPRQAKAVGLLDILLRDMSVEQFQELFPAMAARVEGRVLMEISLRDARTGQVVWSRLVRGVATREHVMIPKNYMEPALSEAYSKCLQQIRDAVASAEVRSLL